MCERNVISNNIKQLSTSFAGNLQEQRQNDRVIHHLICTRAHLEKDEEQEGEAEEKEPTFLCMLNRTIISECRERH
eukprot:m.169146 g.169146  ORF g.169146 m.169146 type:complete len:76 (-) comp16472_c4_seq1:2959-3186(-)